MNKRIYFIIYTIILLLLCGCWNYKEIEKLALVSGMAIDKSTTNDMLDITLEVVNLGEGEKDVKPKSQKFESKGKTIYDALNNSLKISSKRLFWSHALAVVLSEDFAKDGILPIVDWLYRDLEPRLTLQLYVSKEKMAKDIFSLQTLSSDIRAYEIDFMLQSDRYLSKTPSIKLYELMNELNSPGIYPVLPVLESTVSGDINTIALAGGAIFNKDKFAGYMEPEDVKYYMFLRNKVKGGVLLIGESSKDKKDIVTLNVINNKTKIKPILKDGKLSMKVDLKTNVDIVEIDSNFDYLSKEGIEVLNSKAEKLIKEELERVIKMIQDDYGLDIFGFGQIVKDKYPKLWKEIGNEWDAIFKDLDVEMYPVVKVRSSGHFRNEG